jgi:hypothetical protein
MSTRLVAVHFLQTIIKPSVAHIGLWTPAASELLLGTALVESRLLHRRQLGGGPARGYFQMEPATHDDIWRNFLRYRSQLAGAVASLLSSSAADRHNELETNDRYACALARVHYARAPAPLPRAGDVAGMARYWKRHYNTLLGAGTESKYVQTWNSVIGAGGV